MDPVKVPALARGLGDPLPRVLVVGCGPRQRGRVAMNRTTVLLMAILGMMAAAVALQWPEIQRYLKVRAM